VLTHSYEQDRAILASLLPRCLQYLGILGPRHRTERLLAEVAPPLALTIEECFAQLHSPIGLDLGAGDPAAVALSIIAEIQAVLHNRQVQITREAPAHEPASEPAQPWPDTPEAAVRA
jgi:xanthine/CO dehydrogenase XdhC/CoxF family maturation factor